VSITVTEITAFFGAMDTTSIDINCYGHFNAQHLNVYIITGTTCKFFCSYGYNRYRQKLFWTCQGLKGLFQQWDKWYYVVFDHSFMFLPNFLMEIRDLYQQFTIHQPFFAYKGAKKFNSQGNLLF
jgi:hypothetical protein